MKDYKLREGVLMAYLKELNKVGHRLGWVITITLHSFDPPCDAPGHAIVFGSVLKGLIQMRMNPCVLYVGQIRKVLIAFRNTNRASSPALFLCSVLQNVSIKSMSTIDTLSPGHFHFSGQLVLLEMDERLALYQMTDKKMKYTQRRASQPPPGGEDWFRR